ncbi:hatching enzyme 1.2-like [Neocloeon triangulifer]|uniref:hatching enzyme 1.2-like n=1 Tax=Neocloeon triangulifer TaxID=2078957 RepID=UPI00286EC349|nr:hatching enzyme 1.2-like [Neocloeon triangulifer]
MRNSLMLLLLLTALGFSQAASPGVDNSPPQIHHGANYPPDHDEKVIHERIRNWNPNHGSNIWELSGLKEGDIMEPKRNKGKNVVKSRKINWPNGIIPFSLQPGMNQGEKKAVQRGMDLVSKNSCIKFRPWRSSDKDFVHIMYNMTGCWGYVGRQGGGQVISLQRHACFIPGTVAHELLHATGFHHEQSAPNRDDFVFINYTNIEKNKKHQFVKYNTSYVTDYGVGYDYDSLMHYSRKAFSKNGEDTIIPYQPGVEIGQKSHVSEKDYEKLNFKYCNATVAEMENADLTTASSRPTAGPRPGTVVKPDSRPPSNNNNRPSGGNRPGGSGGSRPPGNNSGGSNRPSGAYPGGRPPNRRPNQ